jgi:uncharacterized protein YndB with AHSA1/START domain
MATYVPRELSYADTAPVRIEGEVVADVDPAAAWAVLVDPTGWPDWFGSPVTAAEATSTPATGVGSTRQVRLGPGRGVAIDERFLAWDEPNVWAFTGLTGPPIFRSLVERATIHVEGPGRTRITYRMAFDPAPFLRPALPAMRRGVQRSLTQALGRLVAAAGGTVVR